MTIGTAWTDGSWVDAGWAVNAWSSTASATITGGFTEAQLVSGGQIVTATLIGDTFLATGTGPIGSIANTQALIDGIVSAQSEANGWNAERSNIAVSDLARTSDTVVTLTLPALPNYQITADEVLTWTIPAEAISGLISIVGLPVISVSQDAVIAVNQYHTVVFESSSRSAAFSAAQRRTEFLSASQSILFSDIGEPTVIGFLLKEDGGKILQESGSNMLREKR